MHLLYIDPHPVPDVCPEAMQILQTVDALAQVDAPAAQLVMLRYFGGLTLKEAAASLGVSPRTADSYWAYARAWLLTEMQRILAESS